jgi:hypothetical protein
MKRCPQCSRVETDEEVKFCRVDGATLIIDSSSIGGEAGTGAIGLADRCQRSSQQPSSAYLNDTRYHLSARDCGNMIDLHSHGCPTCARNLDAERMIDRFVLGWIHTCPNLSDCDGFSILLAIACRQPYCSRKVICTHQLRVEARAQLLLTHQQDGAKMVADVLIRNQTKRYLDDRQARKY